MPLRQSTYRLLNEAALLHRLFSEDAVAVEYAWKEFLRRYSDLILKVIWQFERDVDAAMEKYVYVCTHLAEGEFARLRKYRPERHAVPPKLSTWLTIVVKNLCVEQYRVKQGRRRFPRALDQLPAFDRKVFRLYYWKGYTAHEIVQILEGEVSRNGYSVTEALDRIKALALRPSKTWVDGPPTTFIPFSEQYHREDGNPSLQTEALAFSEACLEALTSEERLVVRLRFWEDLSAPNIAALLHGPTPRQVYTILERALKKMRRWARQEV